MGVARGIVSLEYRELSGNMVRPALTQRLTYDLADGDVIGIRGARIKVLSANNTGIRYVVTGAFSE